jgi:hypothetical protein
MNFLNGTLPNVMFLVGVLAVGLGLGIELKLVPLNKEVGRFGRIGAFMFGILLIGASLALYLNPSLTNSSQATLSASMGAAPAEQAASSAAPAAQTIVEQPAGVAGAQVTALPQPAAAAAPTDAPAVQAQAVAAPRDVTVPDLHGLDDKGAQRALSDAGLAAQKAASCSGADEGSPKAKKNRVMCQNPAAGQAVAPGAIVEYALAEK